MNPRERKMAIFLAAFILLGGGGFFAYQFLYVPWQQQTKAKSSLEDEIDLKKVQIAKIDKDLPKLATWRLLSLPNDPVLAQREYDVYLKQLFKRCGWTIVASSGQADIKDGPTLPNKKSMYTALTFSATATATEAGIVQFLEEFAKTPLMHKIKSLNVERTQTLTTGGGNQKGAGMPAGKGFPDMAGKGFAGFGKGKKGGADGFGKKGKGDAGGAFGKKGGGGGGRGERLPVRLQIEALIVHGSNNKHWTGLTGLDDRLVVLDVIAGHFGGVVGLAQVPWIISPKGLRPPQVLAKTPVPRAYSDIARALLFHGQPNMDRNPNKLLDYDDVKQFVKLWLISWDSKLKRGEAKLYNLLTDGDVRLRDDDSGYKKFVILDDDRQVYLRGEVLKISDREVYFSANGEIFSLHVGDTLAEAMWQAVPQEEAQRLGLLAKAK